MFSPTKDASDRKIKGEELDERKLVYLLCENLSQNPGLREIMGRGAEGVTSLSGVWKQYEEEQIDIFIMLQGYESLPPP